MTNTDGTTRGNLRIPRGNHHSLGNAEVRSNRGYWVGRVGFGKKRTRSELIGARIETWNQIIGSAEDFVQNPPLEFQLDNFEGKTMIVRLMRVSEEMISWIVEIQYSDMKSVYYTLYYWRTPCSMQEYFNRENLLNENQRWADNMTDARHETAICRYNPIMEMLEDIGVDPGETF